MSGCFAVVDVAAFLGGVWLEPSTVVVRGEHIEAVGTAIPAPVGCDVVDGRGKRLTAGLIDVSTALGVSEIGLEPATVDDTPDNGDPVRSGLVVVDAYDPRSVQVAVARRGGVTSVVVHPGGGLVSGQAGLVHLAGQTWAEAVIDPSVAMFATPVWGGSRAEGLLRLREVLEEARFFRANEAAWLVNRTRPLGMEALDLRAMGAVLDRAVPLVVGADRAADLEALARFAEDQSVRLVVQGAAEGWMVADTLAAAGVSVVVDPLVYGAGSFDQIYGREDNAALLAAAGVSVMVSTFDGHNARDLRVRAGNAVRGGLSHEAALASITEVPGRVFAGGSIGRIAPALSADLVLWSGDPLEIASRVESVWIAGIARSLETRQTALRDRYLDR